MEKCMETYIADCLAACEDKWVWQDREYRFDFCSLGDGIRLQIALTWLREGLSHLPTEEKITGNTKEISTLITAFFTIVFGEEAAPDFADDGENAMEAYLHFMDHVLGQNELLVQFREYAQKRYVSPLENPIGKVVLV